MTEAEVQELSEPSVDGADEFEGIGHEKGIHYGALPVDLEEDQANDFRPTISGDMVKKPAKHFCPSKSPSLSKSKDKGKEKDKSNKKEKSNKKRHHKHPHTQKNSNVERVNEASKGDNTPKKVNKAGVTQLDTEQEQRGVHLVEDDDSVPPPDPVAETFTHLPRVGGRHPV